MTLIEKVYRETGDDNLWDVIEKRCPISVFEEGYYIPKVCEQECSTYVTCVNCPVCWTQEYKEKYGRVNAL